MTPEELAERGLRVKPLDWVDNLGPSNFDGLGLRNYSYNVRKIADGLWRMQGHASTGIQEREFPTLEAAKAAAEADHASRIAAQLEGMG